MCTSQRAHVGLREAASCKNPTLSLSFFVMCFADHPSIPGCWHAKPCRYLLFLSVYMQGIDGLVLFRFGLLPPHRFSTLAHVAMHQGACS